MNIIQAIKSYFQDDLIRSPEDLKKALPDLKIFTLPEVPKEPEIKLYQPEEEDLKK